MVEARTQTSRRWLWVGVVVVLIAVFLGARSLLREHLLVRAAQVQRQQIVNTVSTNGQVEPEQPYQFYSPISTTVKAVYTQVGDVVSAGKLLVILDDVEAMARVATAESAVKAAQAQMDAATQSGTQAERQASAAEVVQDRLTLEQAQHDLQSLTHLQATGAAAPGEVLAAKQRVATAQSALDASLETSQHRYSPDEIARAQASLSDAQAALAAARQVEAQTRIIAPIKGTVYSMDAAPSEFQEQGKLMLQMADLKQQRVRAFFDEPDIGRLAVGQQAIIRWEAKPGEVWHGHITRLPASVVEYTTRIVGEVLIALDHPESGLLPGTHVTVQVTTSSEPNALSMPREALHSENGQYYVYKIVGSQLKRTQVTIGAPTLTQVPILSGLEEGDWVATGTINGEPLQESVPIEIQH
jgi:HlyD family secretion protein